MFLNIVVTLLIINADLVWNRQEAKVVKRSTINKMVTSCVSQSCRVEVCRDGICHTATMPVDQKPRIITSRNCPIAVCPKRCNDIRLLDHCPVCRCTDYGLQGMCDTDSDCSARSCVDNLCRIPRIPDTAPLFCSYSYDCPAYEECKMSACKPTDTREAHLVGDSGRCMFARSCPRNHICKDNTCWEGESDHVPDRFCIWDNQCPNRYTCDKDRNMCMNTGTDHTDVHCIWESQCPSMYKCVDSSCILGGRSHIEGVQCVFESTCPTGYQCEGFTCYE